MAALTVDDTALRKLSASFEGDLVMVGDPTYEEHRKVWNGSIDRFPALIARCRGLADLMAAVKFARSAGLRVAVRGGGHSYPGHSVCDSGIVIDLGADQGDPRGQGGARRGSRPACFGASSTARRSGWRPPASSSATPASPA